jgi:hypothetical protein
MQVATVFTLLLPILGVNGTPTGDGWLVIRYENINNDLEIL